MHKIYPKWFAHKAFHKLYEIVLLFITVKRCGTNLLFVIVHLTIVKSLGVCVIIQFINNVCDNFLQVKTQTITYCSLLFSVSKGLGRDSLAEELSKSDLLRPLNFKIVLLNAILHRKVYNNSHSGGWIERAP